MRLACFGPLPPAHTGIAAYSADLLPALARHADVTLFAPDPAAVAPSLRAALAVHPLAAFPAQVAHFDLTLHQMGNSIHHDPFYPYLRRYPGLTVLHDVVLHHFMATQTYARELAYALGAAQAQAVRRGEVTVDPFAVPLHARVLDASLGVIVHSRYAADGIGRTHPHLPVAVVPLVMPMPAAAPPAAGGITLASIGQISRTRLLDRSLAAFARLHADHPETRYLIVGEALDVDVPALLAALPPAARAAVTWTGYVADDAAFDRWIAAADIVVNLRLPTAGETSAAALRALAAGKPLIVVDAGWYAELPDAVAHKVSDLTVAALTDAMRALLAPDRRQAMGHAARTLIAHDHAPDAVARRVAAFAASVLDGVWQRVAAAPAPDA